MIQTGDNSHRSAPFSRPVGWFWHHQLYSGVGADIVMESISLIDLRQQLLSGGIANL
jgi:hypothetical protein